MRTQAREIDPIKRYRGSLLGLAVGDGLGTALEFKPPGSFRPIDDMVGGGPFHLRPGEWTDDTSMALCLAESLIERKGFDPVDQIERYLRWYREGYLSSTGRCSDIGGTTRSALLKFERPETPTAALQIPHQPEMARSCASQSSQWTKSRSSICLDQFPQHLELGINDRTHNSHVYIWKSNPRLFEMPETEGS